MEQKKQPEEAEQGRELLWHGRPVPPQFPYLQVLQMGRPTHQGDDFYFRHPPMERGKRAKLFAPFDALDGYSESLARKEEEYVDRVELDEEQRQELNRRLAILRQLAPNSRAVRAHPVAVTVRYYAPCADAHSFSCGVRGRYETLTGVVRQVDGQKSRTLRVEDTAVPFDDILSLTAEDETVFAEAWEP